MNRIPTIIGLCFCLPLVVSAGERSNEAQAAHRIVAFESTDALPADIASMFRLRSEEFAHFATEPGHDWTRDAKMRKRVRWHDIQIDIESENQSTAARIEAALRFPRDKRLAGILYRKHALHTGGTLPWAVEACFDQLVKAFRSGSETDIIKSAGHLAHFATDAALPLRTTTGATGKSNGNAVFSISRGPHGPSSLATVRARFEVGLIATRSTEYAQAVHVEVSDYEPVTDAAAVAFAVVLDSLKSAEPILEADRETLLELEITNRREMKQRQAEYVDAVHARCGPLVVERLTMASRLTADLIGGAWEAAGLPTVAGIRARTTEPSAAKRTAGGRFVGSRRSVVFHVPSCRFAKQISDDNLMYFESAVTARREGRRACRLCDPQP